MTDKPPETALDRLRAGLYGGNGAAPDANPDPAPEQPAPVQPAPESPRDRPPAAPAGSRGPEPAANPPPQGPVPGGNRLRALQEALDRRQIHHREDLSETRRRINLTWTVAVALTAGVIAAASYLYATNMQDDWFRRLWPWRHHVWSQQGAAVLWCMNEARKRDGRIDCTITVGEHGPDCPDIRDPDSIAIGTMFRCKPWDGGWPTDPAPRWSAKGPPLWTR